MLSEAHVAMNSAKGAGLASRRRLARGLWPVPLAQPPRAPRTLAWLGGGSLASGGLGMTGRNAVLGGSRSDPSNRHCTNPLRGNSVAATFF